MTVKSFGSLVLLTVPLLSGCASNVYRVQAELLEEYSRKFQAHITREQLEAAVHENPAIELMALRLKSGRTSGS